MNQIKNIILIGALVLIQTTLSGCAAGIAQFDQIMERKVLNKAAFDFQCPQDQLSVSKVNEGTYGVTGCGNRATYVGKDGFICWHGNSVSNLENACVVVPDTFSSENK